MLSTFAVWIKRACVFPVDLLPLHVYYRKTRTGFYWNLIKKVEKNDCGISLITIIYVDRDEEKERKKETKERKKKILLFSRQFFNFITWQHKIKIARALALKIHTSETKNTLYIHLLQKLLPWILRIDLYEKCFRISIDLIRDYSVSLLLLLLLLRCRHS